MCDFVDCDVEVEVEVEVEVKVKVEVEVEKRDSKIILPIDIATSH